MWCFVLNKTHIDNTNQLSLSVESCSHDNINVRQSFRDGFMKSLSCKRKGLRWQLRQKKLLRSNLNDYEARENGQKQFFKLTEMALLLVAARYFKANLFTLKLMTMNEQEGRRLRSLKTSTIREIFTEISILLNERNVKLKSFSFYSAGDLISRWGKQGMGLRILRKEAIKS